MLVTFLKREVKLKYLNESYFFVNVTSRKKVCYCFFKLNTHIDSLPTSNHNKQI